MSSKQLLGMRLAGGAWMVGLLLAASIARADSVSDKLEPHVGKTLDVIELVTGRRFVRPTLERVTVRGDTTASVRIFEEGQSKPMTLPIPTTT